MTLRYILFTYPLIRNILSTEFYIIVPYNITARYFQSFRKRRNYKLNFDNCGNSENAILLENGTR